MDNPASAGFGLFNAGGFIFMIVGISLSKKLADKYGKRDVFGIALFLSTIFILVFVFFSPQDLILMYIAQILHGFFYGITIPILWAMIADVADYSEWKTNRRATAIVFSAMLMGLKAGLSIGGAFITWILSVFNYIEPTDQNIFIIQSAETVRGIKLLVSVFPSIFFFIACALLFFYKINKKMESQIEKELAERRNNQ